MKLAPHWSDEQKKSFLWQQFTAQHNWYQQQYQGASFLIIEWQKQPIGRLYLAPTFGDGSVRIIDITLLPAYRNKGFGESMLRDIIELARTHQKTVTIHVESFNPARQLYERLGFVLKDRKNEVYHLYEWRDDTEKNLINEVE